MSFRRRQRTDVHLTYRGNGHWWVICLPRGCNPPVRSLVQEDEVRIHRFWWSLLAAGILVLAGCDWSGGTSSSSSRHELPAGLTQGVSGAAPAPSGWYRVLNGQRFTDGSGIRGITGSRPQPGTLAGCPLPAQRPDTARPT